MLIYLVRVYPKKDTLSVLHFIFVGVTIAARPLGICAEVFSNAFFIQSEEVAAFEIRIDTNRHT